MCVCAHAQVRKLLLAPYVYADAFELGKTADKNKENIYLHDAPATLAWLSMYNKKTQHLIEDQSNK